MRWKEVEGSKKPKLKKLSEIAPRKAEKLADNAGQLDEGRRFIKVNNREQIGIDKAHVKGQQEHAHLENGRAVNKDGTVSHGGPPFELTRDQAVALKHENYKIAKSRLVESDGSKITVELDPAVLGFLIDLQAYLMRAPE